MGRKLTSKPVPGDWNGTLNAIAKLDRELNSSASPEFAGVTLTGLTANALIYPTSVGVLTSLAAATNGQLVIGSTGAAPSVTALTGTANQITITPGAGSITLSTPQDIHTGASPTFANLSLGTGELTAGSINRASGTLTLEIGGTAEISITSSAITLGGNLIIPNAGYIGSVSDTDAMQIEADGDIVMSQDLGVTGAVTAASLTVTNCAVLGSDSAVFQPNSDATTFFQVLDADGGTSVFNVDTTNERVGIRTDSPQGMLDVNGMVIDNTGIENIFIGEGTLNGGNPNHSVFMGHHAGFNNDITGAIGGYNEPVGTRNVYIGVRAGAGETITSGTVTGTYNSTAIVGTDTLFTTELTVGEIIWIGYIPGGTYGIDGPDYGVFEIDAIADDTHLTLTTNYLDDTGTETFIVKESGSNKGSENIAIGHLALALNTEGYENTAVGDNALQWNTTGAGNVALGNDALQGTNGVAITGSFNTALGTDALYVLTSGGYNTAVGYRALQSTTTQSYQTAIGFSAGTDNTQDYLTSLGYRAGREGTGTNQVAIGYDAGYQNTGNNQTAIGFNAGYQNTGINQNVHGYYAGRENTGARVSAFGHYAGYQNSGNDQSVFGHYAGNGNSAISQSAFGRYAGYQNSGARQSAFGYSAGESNTQADVCVFGHWAGFRNVGTLQNAFGSSAGRSNVGNNQTAFGYKTGQENFGNLQTAMGNNAGFRNTGDRTFAFGFNTLSANDGDDNVAMGYEAFNSWTDDAGNAKTFDNTDVDVGNNRVTINAHGFGEAGTYTYRNLEFNQGTAALPGVTDGTRHVWEIIDANTLELMTDTMTGQGTGVGHELMPQVVYKNSMALGASAEPTASFQIMLGNGNTTEVFSSGVGNFGGLILAKASGKGIKVDQVTPTFGWRDLQGDILIKKAGANDPDYNDYATTGIYRHQFKNTAMTQIFNEYHIPHDYVPGTDVFMHIHWSQTTIDTGGLAGIPGNAKWYFDANYSKGHDRGAFPAGVVTVSPAAQAASGTIRKHMIAEVQLSTSGQIGGQDLEPDGIVTVRSYRDAADPADTLDQRPWVHHADIHYQSTNMATKDKAPDFYA